MNVVESLNYQLRKVTKNRSTFCTDDAILKILYLTCVEKMDDAGQGMGTGVKPVRH